MKVDSKRYFGCPWTSKMAERQLRTNYFSNSHLLHLVFQAPGAKGLAPGPAPGQSSIHPSIWSNPVDFCLIWPQNPFPVLHCPVFMLLSKLKMVLSMSLFEKWLFLLDNREKVPFLECISHCLGRDRRGTDIIDKMSSLNSIIKLSSGDLMDNWLYHERKAWKDNHHCYFPCLNLLFS